MPRVTHFEIHVDEPERATKFFSDVFGWEFNKWEGPMEYWLIKTGEEGTPGINGGMMKRRDPDGAVYNSIDVTDIDDYISKVTSAGGVVVVDKMAFPGVGYLAYFKDTEGNVHGMMQEDTKAK